MKNKTLKKMLKVLNTFAVIVIMILFIFLLILLGCVVAHTIADTREKIQRIEYQEKLRQHIKLQPARYHRALTTTLRRPLGCGGQAKEN